MSAEPTAEDGEERCQRESAEHRANIIAMNAEIAESALDQAFVEYRSPVVAGRPQKSLPSPMGLVASNAEQLGRQPVGRRDLVSASARQYRQPCRDGISSPPPMADLRELAANVLRNLRARGLASEVNFDSISTAHAIFEAALRDASLILMPLVSVIDVIGSRPGSELPSNELKDYAGITDQLAGIELRLASIAERLERTENLDMATKAEISNALRAAITDQSNLRVSIENMIHAFADQVQSASEGGNMDDIKSLVDDLRAGSSTIATAVMANTPAAHLAGPAVAGAGGPVPPAPAATTRTLDTTTAPLPASPAEGDTFDAKWSDGTTTPLTFRGGTWVATNGSGSIDSNGNWVPSTGGAGTGGAGAAGTGPTSTNLDTQGTGPAAGAAGNISGAGVA